MKWGGILTKDSKRFLLLSVGMFVLAGFLTFAIGFIFPKESMLVAEGEIKGVVSDTPDFGDGRDGALTVTVTAFDNPIDSSAVGAALTNTLTATNSLFTSGQKILILQMRGVTAGVWEINEIQSYANGVITTVNPLENSYATSGNNAAQVLVLKQYTNVTVNDGVVLSAKRWNGSVGGVLSFLANGTITINGRISAIGGIGGVSSRGSASGGAGGGFRGGVGFSDVGGDWFAKQGEGSGGAGVRSYLANGNGGGAGQHNQDQGHSGGGGGGNGGVGLNGINARGGGGSNFGHGGSVKGTADLVTMVMGGGGGGGSTNATYASGGGGGGGGIIFVSGETIAVTGLLQVNGGAGGSANGAGGGGGGGGSILLKAKTATLGSSLVTATGGLGGTTIHSSARGGNGGLGRIRIEYCDSLVGTTIPSASVHQLDCIPPNEPPVAIAGTSLDEQGQLELNGSLSSDPDGSIVSYDWEIDSQTRSGEVVSVADFASGEYTVMLMVTDDMGATDSNTILLGIPVRSMSDPTSPEVLATTPINGAVNVATNTNIQMQFSENMDVELTEAAFSITPETLGRLSVSGKTLMFIPSGKLTGNILYTVTVGASARDLVGNPLGSDYSFSFTTGNK